ncbi:hypothetical protein MBLNU230_g7844t1 [Neophaeotheca triangularis]
MIFPTAGRSTIHRLHQTVQRNLSRNHTQHRHQSTNNPPTRNAYTSSTSEAPRPQQPTWWRTIPLPSTAWIEPIMPPFRAYGRMQARSPKITQLSSTLTIYYLGDLSAQTILSNGFTSGSYEPIRGVRALIIGGIMSLPSYNWFLFLGRHFNYPSHLASLAVKICVNQTVFTPLFNTYFFGMQVLLAGEGVGKAWERVKQTVPTSIKNSWKVWPLVTAFSFTFVRPQFRSVFAGVVAIGWQSYLSWLNSRAEKRGLVGEGASDGGGKKGGKMSG